MWPLVYSIDINTENTQTHKQLKCLYYTIYAYVWNSMLHKQAYFSPLKFKTDYVDIYQYLDRRFWLIYRLKNLSISETHCTSIATASAWNL